MKTLSLNWITEKHIDFEYKKYLLLSYLQEVSHHFEQSKLYPTLADLITHYKNILLLKENKQLMFERFPERITRADFEKFQWHFEKVISDDATMHEIENIIEFSIPQFEKYLGEGKKIYDLIEENLRIQPVGIIPLNPSAGYLFLQNGGSRETKVYEYQVSIFENPEEKYRGIHTRFISNYMRNISTTFEFIKDDLVRNNKDLPNPATYAVEAELKLPVAESLFPVALRMLMKQLAAHPK